MKAATLSINGVGLTLRFSEAKMAARIVRRFGPFLTDPPAKRELFIRPSDSLVAKEDRFDIRSYFDGDTLNLRASSTRCFYNPHEGRGELEIASCTFGTEEIIENALRYIFQLLSINHHCMMVHASAVIEKKRNRAFLFMGPEGAGKTTIARLSKRAGHQVLNDDMILLMLEQSSLMAKSVPFYGDSSVADIIEKRASEVGGIFHIIKSNQTRARKVSSAEALADLLSNVPYIESYSKELYQSILGCANDILKDYPVYQLEFEKNESVWNEIGRLQAASS